MVQDRVSDPIGVGVGGSWGSELGSFELMIFVRLGAKGWLQQFFKTAAGKAILREHVFSNWLI